MAKFTTMFTGITKNRNLPFRVMLLLLISIPLFYFDEFKQHFYVYLTGNVLTSVITQKWDIVLLSILLFLLFLIPLSFRRKANWAEYGLATAFFVSLFVEMYGIPLTILFASKYFYTVETKLPDTLITFSFLGVHFAMDLVMIYGTVLIVIGAFLITVGWITLYRNIEKEGPVTGGIYSHSRHPQYLGFILIIIGWFIGWPTILTVVLSPVLVYMYIRLCKTEEKEMMMTDTSEYKKYEEYKQRVPFFM